MTALHSWPPTSLQVSKFHHGKPKIGNIPQQQHRAG